MKTLSKLAKICSFCLLALVLVSIISTKTASAASSVTAKLITFKVDGKTYKTTTIYTTAEYGSALYYTKPTKVGYTFAGWYSAASGGTKADTSHLYTTVYAHWNCVHEWRGSYSIIKNATCMASGTQKYKCWKCGTAYGSVLTIPQKAHSACKVSISGTKVTLSCSCGTVVNNPNLTIDEFTKLYKGGSYNSYKGKSTDNDKDVLLKYLYYKNVPTNVAMQMINVSFTENSTINKMKNVDKALEWGKKITDLADKYDVPGAGAIGYGISIMASASDLIKAKNAPSDAAKAKYLLDAITKVASEADGLGGLGTIVNVAKKVCDLGLEKNNATYLLAGEAFYGNKSTEWLITNYAFLCDDLGTKTAETYLLSRIYNECKDITGLSIDDITKAVKTEYTKLMK